MAWLFRSVLCPWGRGSLRLRLGRLAQRSHLHVRQTFSAVPAVYTMLTNVGMHLGINNPFGFRAGSHFGGKTELIILGQPRSHTGFLESFVRRFQVIGDSIEQVSDGHVSSATGSGF